MFKCTSNSRTPFYLFFWQQWLKVKFEKKIEESGKEYWKLLDHEKC